MKAAIIASLLFILIALGGFAGSLYTIKKYCPNDKPDVNIKSGSYGRHTANNAHGGIAANTIMDANYPNDTENTNAQHLNRVLQYACDMKAGELALAWFTLLLVFVTSALVFIGVRQESWSKAHERAYLYGGVGFRNIVRVGEELHIRVQVSMANYGKTPGFIERIVFGTHRLHGLPREPRYPHGVEIRDVFFPLMTIGEVRPTRAVLDIPGDGEHVFFQRVFYRDIFKKLHYSGSIHRMFITGGGTVPHAIGDEPIAGEISSKYWKWT